MIKFLRRNQQVFILITILYGLLAVTSLFIAHTNPYFLNHPFTYPLLGDFLLNLSFKTGSSIAFAVVCYIFLLFIGFYLTKLTINYQIVTKRSQFTALFYIAIATFAFTTELFSGAVIASLFLLLALNRIIGSSDIRGNTFRFLDAGILIAVGSLFYMNLIFLIPFIWVSQLILRPSSWRELVFAGIGIVVPFIYIFSGAYLFNQSITDSWLMIKEWLVLSKVVSLNQTMKISIGLYSFVILTASLFAFNKFATSKIQARKLFQVLFSLFINMALIGLLVPSAGIEMLYLIAIPLSVLFSIYFTDCRASFLNRILLLLLLTAPILAVFAK